MSFGIPPQKNIKRNLFSEIKMNYMMVVFLTLFLLAAILAQE